MLERIYIEIGNICNLSCSFCQGTKKAPRQMSEAEFSLVLDRIKGHTKYIYLHVMGEPLLHPQLDSLLKIAESHKLPVCITTNGTLLNKNGHILAENSNIIHKVSISLHAPEGNGISDLENYLSSAVDFAKSASQKGIYIVFRLWNRDSVEGRGENRENPRIEEFLQSSFTEEWQNRPRGFRIAQNVFLEYDGLFTWPASSTAEAVSDGFCHGLSTQLAILADGSVVPCCLDANGEIELGNIFDTSLDEILSKERAKAIKEGFALGKFTEPLCQKCTFARRFKKRNN